MTALVALDERVASRFNCYDFGSTRREWPRYTILDTRARGRFLAWIQIESGHKTARGQLHEQDLLAGERVFFGEQVPFSSLPLDVRFAAHAFFQDALQMINNAKTSNAYTTADGRRLRVVGKNMLVKIDPPQEVTRGGIVIPDSAHADIYATGTIVAVGTIPVTYKSESGKLLGWARVPIPDVEVGTRVLFIKFLGIQDSNKKVRELLGDDIFRITATDIVLGSRRKDDRDSPSCARRVVGRVRPSGATDRDTATNLSPRLPGRIRYLNAYDF